MGCRVTYEKNQPNPPRKEKGSRPTVTAKVQIKLRYYISLGKIRPDISFAIQIRALQKRIATFLRQINTKVFNLQLEIEKKINWSPGGGFNFDIIT